MGLDISNGTWHGSYSAFMRWRIKIAEVAGLPPLELMEGFYLDNPDAFIVENPIGRIELFCQENQTILSITRELKKSLPIKWKILKTDVLYKLLLHSDCDGKISWQVAGKLAKRLKELLSLLPDEDVGGHIGNWKDKTETFIKGCELAHSKKEDLEFY